MILVDSSVLSLAFRRRGTGVREARWRETLDDLFAAEVEIGIPAIVLQEVLSGVRDEGQFRALAQRLRDAFHVLLGSEADHVAAAELFNRCRAAGLNVSAIDCLVATQAVSGDHELLADDSDFDRIAEHTPLDLFRRRRK